MDLSLQILREGLRRERREEAAVAKMWVDYTILRVQAVKATEKPIFASSVNYFGMK